MAVPHRIVCLSAEAADWLWRIGAWEHVVGVSSFFRAPKHVNCKVNVGGFSTAQIERIQDLNPDLIITFSRVQIPFVSELIRRGFPVLATNQRTLEDIENTLEVLSAIVKRHKQGQRMLQKFRTELKPLRRVNRRPRVYFEEWNEPLVTGISWISELIERAGGDDIFEEFRNQNAACDRVVSSDEVRRRNPEIIFASWCGRPVRFGEIRTRPGWSELRAVKSNKLIQIPPEDILQPGFRLIYGFERIKRIVRNWKP